jgi:hypothetical protein
MGGVGAKGGFPPPDLHRRENAARQKTAIIGFAGRSRMRNN